MKEGIAIVNTARGAVMDETALVEALDSGQVSSAGLDVYEHEPSIHPGLLANPRTLLVPHMGTWTVETEKKMEDWYVQALTATHDPAHLLLPAVSFLSRSIVIFPFAHVLERLCLTTQPGPSAMSGWQSRRDGCAALFQSNDTCDGLPRLKVEGKVCMCVDISFQARHPWNPGA